MRPQSMHTMMQCDIITHIIDVQPAALAVRATLCKSNHIPSALPVRAVKTSTSAVGLTQHTARALFPNANAITIFAEKNVALVQKGLEWELFPFTTQQVHNAMQQAPLLKLQAEHVATLVSMFAVLDTQGSSTTPRSFVLPNNVAPVDMHIVNVSIAYGNGSKHGPIDVLLPIVQHIAIDTYCTYLALALGVQVTLHNKVLSMSLQEETLDAAVVCGYLLALYAKALHPHAFINVQPWTQLYESVRGLEVAAFDSFCPQTVRVINKQDQAKAARKGANWKAILIVFGLGLLTVLAALGPSLPVVTQPARGLIDDTPLHGWKTIFGPTFPADQPPAYPLGPLVTPPSNVLTGMADLASSAVSTITSFFSPAVVAAPTSLADCKSTTGTKCVKTYPEGFPQHPKYAFVQEIVTVHRIPEVVLPASKSSYLKNPKMLEYDKDAEAFEKIVEQQNTLNTMPEVTVLPQFADTEHKMMSYFKKNKMWEYDAIFLQYEEYDNKYLHTDTLTIAGFVYMTEQAHKYGIPVVVLRTNAEWTRDSRTNDNKALNKLSKAFLPAYVCSLPSVSAAMDQSETTGEPACANPDIDTLAWSVRRDSIKLWSDEIRGVTRGT